MPSPARRSEPTDCLAHAPSMPTVVGLKSLGIGDGGVVGKSGIEQSSSLCSCTHGLSTMIPQHSVKGGSESGIGRGTLMWISQYALHLKRCRGVSLAMPQAGQTEESFKPLALSLSPVLTAPAMTVVMLPSVRELISPPAMSSADFNA